MHVVTITWKNGPKWDPAVQPNFRDFILSKSFDNAKAQTDISFLTNLPISFTNEASADPAVSWVTTISVLDEANGESIKNQIVQFYENVVKTSRFSQDYTVEVTASQI